MGPGFHDQYRARARWQDAGSLAWAGLGNTYFWIDPAKCIAGVILMQLVPFADSKALKLYDRFEKAVYAELP